MNKLGQAERAAWGDFPKVIRNGDLGDLSKEPEYRAAKQGDMEAALNLVDRLLSDETVSQIKELIGDEKPRVLPVLAAEASGNNKIPLMFAEVLADRLGLAVETGIVQAEKVHRTDSGADHRLAFNPSFLGDVTAGQKYLIVDDTLTMGGTLASLRGYVENRGGSVVAASVMTAHQGAVDMAVKPKMLAAIEAKHGNAMDSFWKENFGHGIDKLTQGEAGHLKSAASVDAIRDRIAAARHGASERLGASGTQTPPPGTQSVSAIEQDGLYESAQELERQQQALLEAAPVEQSYQESLATYVQAKHDQVERIEDKIENLIDQQQARLQQTLASQPGMFSRAGTKAAWQAQQMQQQARLQSLHGRLEAVREIKDGMGIHAPKIEELATRKLRAQEPGLASEFDEMQEAQRRHQALLRKQEQERKQKLQQEQQQQQLGRALRLGLSQQR